MRLARAHAVLDAKDERFAINLSDTLNRLLTTMEAPTPDVLMETARTEVPPWRAVSTVTKNFLGHLRDAAAGHSAVFLHGEPGSGKHLAAMTLRRWRRESKSTQVGEQVTDAHGMKVVVLNVPPLRERIHDLPLLAGDILQQSMMGGVVPLPQLSSPAAQALMHRLWRGNVRELQAVLCSATTEARRAGHQEILAEDLPVECPSTRTPSQQCKDEGQLEAVLRQIRAAGSVRGAAKLELIPRANYMRLMRRLGVIRADTRPYGEDEPE